MSLLNVRLRRGLPVVDVIVSMGGPKLRELSAAGEPLPNPIMVTGLIDTGASGTCIDPQVLRALQLDVIGTTEIHTPSTGATPLRAPFYDVGLILTSGAEDRLILPNLRVTAADLLAVQGFHVLLGRDVLSRCLLVYDGRQQSLTLAY